MSNDTPSFNFEKEVNAEVIGGNKIGEQFNAEGDQSIDKSQHMQNTQNVDTGGGEFSGDFKGGDNIQGGKEIHEHLNELFNEMVTKAPELTSEQLEVIKEPEPIDTPKLSVGYDFTEEETPNFENNEDHPLAVKAMIENMSDESSEEEQRSLFHRMTSSVKKYATSDVAIGAAKLTHVGIQALSVTPPPYNIIGPVLGAAIKMMGA